MSSANRHRPRVALLPPEIVPNYLKTLRTMVSAMQAVQNKFPGAAPLLKKLSASLDALEKAEFAIKTGPPGMAGERNIKLDEVRLDVTPVLALVQQLIDKDPDHAEKIVGEIGLHLHQTISHGPQHLAAHEGEASGSVRITAPSNGGGAHTFQCSLDNAKSWGEPLVSDVAHVTFTNLPIGTTALFRHRFTLHGITGDWSQPISFVVR